MARLNPRRLAPDDQDLGNILTLIQDAFAYMDGRIDPPSSMYHLDIAKLRQQAQDHEIWAIGTPPVACVFLTQHATCLYLGKLAVAHSHRGQGLARELIELAQGRARDLGRKTLELETRIELVENQALFQSLGFQKTAETAHPGYSQPTSITYSKDVT